MSLAAAPAIVEVSSDPAAWIAIAAAVVATLGTIVASAVAAISARSDKKSELQAQRISELEDRISERKYEIYKPLIEMLGEVVNSDPNKALMDSSEVMKRLHEFFIWVSIYGSDESVIAFRNFHQAASNGVPPEIATRLYAELVLAARRDIARSDSRIGAVEIMAMKVNDLYSSPDYYKIMALPFDEVCKIYGWTPPWSSSNVYRLKHEKPGRLPSTLPPPS
ncbi:MAG TPA: hypothetical protein VHZ33_28795 [Trebonia sp.]|jgi:hypothetical protein|nr:hypothetical protein [Trebonia sp.]